MGNKNVKLSNNTSGVKVNENRKENMNGADLKTTIMESKSGSEQEQKKDSKHPTCESSKTDSPQKEVSVTLKSYSKTDNKRITQHRETVNAEDGVACFPVTWENSLDSVLHLADTALVEKAVRAHVTHLRDKIEEQSDVIQCLCDTESVCISLWKIFEQTKLKLDIRKIVVRVCVEEHFSQILMKILRYLQRDGNVGLKMEDKSWRILKKILLISWILSDSEMAFCHQLITLEALSVLSTLQTTLNCNDCSQSVLNIFYTKFILGITHNCLRHVNDCRNLVRDTFKVDLVQKVIDSYSTNPMIHAKALIVLSYIIYGVREQQSDG